MISLKNSAPRGAALATSQQLKIRIHAASGEDSRRFIDEANGCARRTTTDPTVHSGTVRDDGVDDDTQA
jgi:hypothetical protein